MPDTAASHQINDPYSRTDDASDDDFETFETGLIGLSEDLTTEGVPSIGNFRDLLNPTTEDPDIEGYNPDIPESDHASLPDETDQYEDQDIREGPYMRIHGEPFHVRQENGRVIISHDRWSLIGYGDTLIEAEKELFRCARRLSSSYLERPADEMSTEAVRMRNFIADVLSYAELT